MQGAVEALVFTTNYERLQAELVEDRAVMVKGSALPEENGADQDLGVGHRAAGGGPGATAFADLDSGLAGAGNGTAALGELFQRKPGDTQVRLRLEKSRDFSVILDIDAKVRPDKEFRAEVERICGPDALEMLAN